MMGPLVAAMESESAGMFDLSESFDDISTGGMPGDGDTVSAIRAAGSMLDRWKGDPG